MGQEKENIFASSPKLHLCVCGTELTSLFLNLTHPKRHIWAVELSLIFTVIMINLEYWSKV